MDGWMDGCRMNRICRMILYDISKNKYLPSKTSAIVFQPNVFKISRAACP